MRFHSQEPDGAAFCEPAHESMISDNRATFYRGWRDCLGRSSTSERRPHVSSLYLFDRPRLTWCAQPVSSGIALAVPLHFHRAQPGDSIDLCHALRARAIRLSRSSAAGSTRVFRRGGGRRSERPRLQRGDVRLFPRAGAPAVRTHASAVSATPRGIAETRWGAGSIRAARCRPSV